MKIDDFESVFRSSIKPRFALSQPQIARALVLSDHELLVPSTPAAKLLPRAQDVQWSALSAMTYSSVSDLLAAVAEFHPDIVFTHRHLRDPSGQSRHTLGAVVDNLTQATDYPIALLPAEFFDTLTEQECATTAPSRVLVVTDHLAGDDTLVNWGVRMCAQAGTLFLAHVEDDHTFQRYADAIAMIPGLDTDETVQALHDKLLSRPRDYIADVARVLAEHLGDQVEPIVTMGHNVVDFRAIINKHDVDMVVFHTNDHNQLAMHGNAYALAVEIIDRPLLLI